MMKKRAGCDTSNNGAVQFSTHVPYTSAQTTHDNHYFAAQTAGNLNIVVIGWGSASNTVSSVTDTAGNTYTKALGPIRSGTNTMYLYYAKNIVASAVKNTVTATISASITGVWLDLHEYQGYDTANPLLTTTSGTGNTVAMTTSSLTTTHACSLIFSASWSDGAVVANGTNYKMRTEAYGSFTQDRVVSTAGSYSSTSTQDGVYNYATVVAAFKKNSGTIAQNAIRKIQWSARPTANWQLTQSVQFTSAQTAGNLNVVVISTYDTSATVSSVTDTSGNTYTKASGPIRGTGISQWVYYANNIAAAAAGANTVTVTMGGTALVSTMILEYTGLSTTSPLDQVASATGTSTNSNSGNVTTTAANELILGFVKTGQHGPEYPTAGSGFTPAAMVTDQNSFFVQEKVVSSTGTYNSTTTFIGGANWIHHIVTFK